MKSLVTCLITLLLLVEGKENFLDDGTIVQLPQGKVRGHVLKSGNGNYYYAFQEIPFAAPPVGENRFQLPKQPEPWSGILNTTKNTKICYQNQSRYDNLQITEDCLYINVYTPEKPGSNNFLPVLFVIHGGGFGSWSGAFEYFGPKYVMDYGIVVVTLNYRLGPFGFVGTTDGIIPTNLGLKDQRFGLEWVHKNIHLFAGNSSQITICGESAGAIAVGIHLHGQWTDNRELFHGAIMQSGNTVSGVFVQEDATTVAFSLGKAVNNSFYSNDTRELLRVLQSAEASALLKTGTTGGICIEKDGPFSHRGFPSFLDGNYKKIPVLTGFNSEELYYLARSKNVNLLKSLDDHPSKLVNELINMSPKNRAVAGNLLKEVYTYNTSFVKDPGGYVRYMSDKSFTTGTCKQVELASAYVPYYFYQFSYKGYLGGDMSKLPHLPPDIGTVGHTEDLKYMWDDGSNSDLSKFSEADQLMLHRYVTMWTNFVKFFNPTPVKDPFLDNITWISTDPKTLRYLNINVTSEMRQHPRQYQQVKEILEKYMEPPYIAFV